MKMNMNIRVNDYGAIEFAQGIPPSFTDYAIPQANISHAVGPFGTFIIQEVQTPTYLLRHFIFVVNQVLSFTIDENHYAIQSLFSLKGDFKHKISTKQIVSIKESEFVLFRADGHQDYSVLSPGKICSLFQSYYTPSIYKDFLSSFPAFKQDLKRAINKSVYFLFPGKVARFSIHDTIHAFWLDKYIGELQAKYIELRMVSTLFTMLAQTYSKTYGEAFSVQEREKSSDALQLISSDITKHYTLTDIASQLHCSPTWLKKAFSKVYGIGMFHYLRKSRMGKARQMLLAGEQLKVVALEVGMKPRNFPKEFKAFYGYTVTALKKGVI